jgi:hypothetical protein
MPEQQPEQSSELDSGFSEDRKKRLNHVLQGVGALLREQQLDIESEHVGARISLQEGVELYIHAGSEGFSLEQRWEAMTADSWLLISFAAHSLDDDAPVGRLRGSLLKLGSKGLQVARGAAGIRDEPEQLSALPEAPASHEQQLELSVFLSRAIDRVRRSQNPKR